MKCQQKQETLLARLGCRPPGSLHSAPQTTVGGKGLSPEGPYPALGILDFEFLSLGRQLILAVSTPRKRDKWKRRLES